MANPTNTMIQVKRKTAKALHDLKEYGEDYDKVIQRLLKVNKTYEAQMR